ncbi:hypothetical protein EBESD8_22800 [Rhodococcus aetherivorans]|nr:hypothetical protein EBESD8_22800 [Rhodococcus aetherivorans]
MRPVVVLHRTTVPAPFERTCPPVGYGTGTRSLAVIRLRVHPVVNIVCCVRRRGRSNSDGKW